VKNQKEAITNRLVLREVRATYSDNHTWRRWSNWGRLSNMYNSSSSRWNTIWDSVCRYQTSIRPLLL